MKIPVTYFTCGFCQNVFAFKARRGRPPKYCDDCKEKAPTAAELKRQRAQERVDNLTKRLSERGMALSQNDEM